MSSTLKSLAQLRVQEAVFICLNRVHLRKVSWIFYLQTFFSNYRSCWLQYFWKLLQWQISKNPATSCMQISLNWTLRICSSWHTPLNCPSTNERWQEATDGVLLVYLCSHFLGLSKPNLQSSCLVICAIWTGHQLTECTTSRKPCLQIILHSCRIVELTCQSTTAVSQSRVHPRWIMEAT